MDRVPDFNTLLDGVQSPIKDVVRGLILEMV